jgi:hypothetical protein
LLQDTERRHAFAAAGRALALQRYTLDRCVSAYRERYAELLEPRTLVVA